jgi:hypothetical protein
VAGIEHHICAIEMRLTQLDRLLTRARTNADADRIAALAATLEETRSVLFAYRQYLLQSN